MSKPSLKLGILCDTGFLIRLNQPQDELHANVRGSATMGPWSHSDTLANLSWCDIPLPADFPDLATPSSPPLLPISTTKTTNMKTASLKSAALALPAAALLALASCSTPIPGEQTTTVKHSATGTTVVDTYKATATVASIDSTNRKLTLTLSNGKTKVVKCGPEIVNFHQIHIHDHVKVTITAETAVYLDKGKPMAGAMGTTTVGVARLGDKPGVVAADTVQATVKISAIDTAARKVTFTNKDGHSETVKVGDHIDLTKVKVGDSVTIRRTEAMAVLVETP